MKEIVINVMKSAIKSMEGRKNSFEIFGLDFLIDDNLNPWLIEINASPTFEITTVFILIYFIIRM